jgi:hypothetical protein
MYMYEIYRPTHLFPSMRVCMHVHEIYNPHASISLLMLRIYVCMFMYVYEIYRLTHLSPADVMYGCVCMYIYV